jgi:hypothetical protein
VKNGAGIQYALHVTEYLLHLPEFLVLEGHLLGRKIGVCPENPLPINRFAASIFCPLRNTVPRSILGYLRKPLLPISDF